MSQETYRAAWLLLVHQLPPRPSNVRVKTWRRLQGLGAIALRNSVYVLPNSEVCREDFEWMKSEIQGMRGEATVFTADSIDTFTNDEVIAAFRRAREEDYATIERDADALAAAASRRTVGTAARQRLARRARQLRDRVHDIDRIAFFPPTNRETADAAVGRLEALANVQPASRSASADTLDVARYQRRVWVTRPRPGIDRMSSAWLIRRFIDPKARFAFAEAQPTSGAAIPFDMYGVEFSHTDHGCTFETLAARFNVASAPVTRIARIVHDIDLKEARYDPLEAPAVAELVEGLRLMYADDGELLARGIDMFEALYRAFAARPESTVTKSTRRARRRAK